MFHTTSDGRRGLGTVGVLLQANALTLACVCLVGGIWTAFYYDLVNEHANRLQTQKMEARSVAVAIERSTRGLLKELDRVALFARQHYLKDRSASGFHQLVSNLRMLSDFAVQVSIAGPDGHMVVSSIDIPRLTSVSIADREHFKVQLDGTKDELFFGKPVLGRVSGVWSVQITRAIRDQAGTFLGVVVLSLSAEQLNKFYRNLSPSNDFAIVIQGVDGAARVSTTDSAGLAWRFPEPQVDPAKLEDGELVADDANDVLHAYRKVDGFGAWVRVSRRLAALPTMVDWLLDARAAIALGLSLIVSAVSLQFRYRALRQEQRRSSELTIRENQSRALADQLRYTLTHMSQGLVVVDGAGCIKLFNDRFRALLHLDPNAELVGTHFNQLIDRVEDAADGDERDGLRRRRFGDALRLSTDPVEASIADCESLDGGILEIRTERLPAGGWLRTFTDVTARRDSEKRIRHIASHDLLTNLANRSLFQGALKEAVEDSYAGATAALLMVDLDRFKFINDTLGHPFGDKLLQAVAERMSQATRETDLVARLGGDEFAVLMRGFKGSDAPCNLGRRLVSSLGKPFTIDDQTINIGASVGIAFLPRDGRDLDELMQAADLALYDAKARGKGQAVIFDRELRDRAETRRSIERDLRVALKEDQFVLHYQGIVDARTGAVVSFEALLRWKHPDRGVVSPAQFIPIAEECGLIIPIGEWVLKTACAQAAEWPEHIGIAVNLSAAQFKSDKLELAVERELGASGLSARRLILEITETAMLNGDAGQLRLLQRLKDRGIALAMDDFGVGYSSLSYLQKFPFDHVKIDGSFIRGLGGPDCNLTLVRSIVDMAKALGMSTTAECIETEVQRDRLQAVGCDHLQGYLFGRPMPASEIGPRYFYTDQRAVA